MITKDKRRVKLLEPTSDPEADKLEENLNSKHEEHDHSGHSCPHCNSDVDLEEGMKEGIALSRDAINAIVEAVEDMENYDSAITVYFTIATACITEGLRKAFLEPEIFGPVVEYKKQIRKSVFQLIKTIPRKFEDEEQE